MINTLVKFFTCKITIFHTFLNSDSNPVYTTSYDNKESAEHDIQSDPVEVINKNNEQSQKNENPEN